MILLACPGNTNIRHFLAKGAALQQQQQKDKEELVTFIKIHTNVYSANNSIASERGRHLSATTD